MTAASVFWTSVIQADSSRSLRLAAIAQSRDCRSSSYRKVVQVLASHSVSCSSQPKLEVVRGRSDSALVLRKYAHLKKTPRCETLRRRSCSLSPIYTYHHSPRPYAPCIPQVDSQLDRPWTCGRCETVDDPDVESGGLGAMANGLGFCCLPP